MANLKYDTEKLKQEYVEFIKDTGWEMYSRLLSKKDQKLWMKISYLVE